MRKHKLGRWGLAYAWFLLVPFHCLGGGALDGLLKGSYASAELMMCVQPVADTETGLFPPLPHLAEVAPSTFALLVESEVLSLNNSGLVEFSGDGTLTQDALSVTFYQSHSSIGQVPVLPHSPSECFGTYSVDSSRRVEVEAFCTQPIPGEVPLTLEVGPFRYLGYLGADPRMLVLNMNPIQPIEAVVKAPDDSVVATYEGLCSSNWVLMRVDRDSLQFPQFGNGSAERLSSDVVLTNPSSNSQVSGTVDFSDDDGLPMEVGIVDQESTTTSVGFTVEPLGAVTISTDGEGELIVGSAAVTADGDLGGVIRFDLPGAGIAGVGPGEVATGLIVPVRREEGGINTGVALINAGENTISLELSLRNEQGEEVAAETILEFPGRGHSAKFVDELFPEYPTAGFRGTLVVRAVGGRIAGTALELDAAAAKFTTLPVTALQ